VRRKPLAVTLGDPAGVGPEIIARAWDRLRSEGPAFLVIGDYETISAAMATRSGGEARRILTPDQAVEVFPDALPVLDQPLTQAVVAGRPAAAHAASIIKWIDMAVALAVSEAVCAVVTAPIAKAPLYEAGFKFPGHTEYLAELCRGVSFAGTFGPVMMLAAPGLRTVLTTIHEPLARAPSLLTIERVAHVGLVTYEALKRDFGIESPRLALAAVNPHAGESGAIGREEIEVLLPAARALRGAGIDCSSPRPADTLFHEEARATYDAVICQYHDQALIPVKMLDFWGGVNVTLGLPIIRTSPDHGVGYDIAGRGVARADSLIAALKTAAEIATRRNAR
jgi:4-hydroxythreonine-4-phosphate dehydrogenase